MKLWKNSTDFVVKVIQSYTFSNTYILPAVTCLVMNLTNGQVSYNHSGLNGGYPMDNVANFTCNSGYAVSGGFQTTSCRRWGFWIRATRRWIAARGHIDLHGNIMKILVCSLQRKLNRNILFQTHLFCMTIFIWSICMWSSSVKLQHKMALVNIIIVTET